MIYGLTLALVFTHLMSYVWLCATSPPALPAIRRPRRVPLEAIQNWRPATGLKTDPTRIGKASFFTLIRKQRSGV